MNQKEIYSIEKALSKELSTERYLHSIGVMDTAACMAMAYNVDIDAALLAGLLHDCAKSIPDTKKITLCKRNKIEISAAEFASPTLLHAKLGAHIAHKKYRVDDQDILNAILYHTTGRPEMSLLEKIVYIADYIEPTRKNIPNLKEIRYLAFHDIDRCMYEVLRATIHHLERRPITIDEVTQEAFRFYEAAVETAQSSGE
ncbi:MAG: bis(5'-nucleosyl)-tetraphosphatase (symmetrical) YqeK [Lachnospiraceae bacterium]